MIDLMIRIMYLDEIVSEIIDELLHACPSFTVNCMHGLWKADPFCHYKRLLAAKLLH